MKNLWTLLFLFIQCEKVNVAKEVRIDGVDFALLTFTRITPTAFDESFEEVKKTKFISDAGKLKKFVDIFENLEEDRKSYIPDVRARVIFFYESASSDTLYLSKLGIWFKNTSMLANDSLVRLIEREL